MLSYEKMKSLLGGEVEGFTQEFYNTYVTEYRDNFLSMIQPEYERQYPPFIKTKASTFYRSPKFIQFESVFNSSKNLSRYKIVYLDEKGQILNHMYHLAENRDLAIQIAEFLTNFSDATCHYEVAVA